MGLECSKTSFSEFSWLDGQLAPWVWRCWLKLLLGTPQRKSVVQVSDGCI